VFDISAREAAQAAMAEMHNPKDCPEGEAQEVPSESRRARHLPSYFSRFRSSRIVSLVSLANVGLKVTARGSLIKVSNALVDQSGEQG